MLPRERVFAVLDFKQPDVIPVEHHNSPAGSYEHGEQLHRLWERFPHDFGDAAVIPSSRPGRQWIDAQGRYREIRRDEWGVVWKHLIFGVNTNCGGFITYWLVEWTPYSSAMISRLRPT